MLTAATFLILYFACLAMALVRHPIYGLYVYLAVVYLHPPSRWWGQILPDLRWSMLAAVVTLVAIFIKRNGLPKNTRPWYATVPGIVLIVLTCWLWIQSLWALDPEMHSEATFLYTKYIVVFYLVYRLVNSPKDAANILLVHVVGCFFLGVLCILEQGARSEGRLDGVGGPNLDDANSLGMFLATGAAAGAVLFLWQSGWRRIVVVLAMPLILNGLILTGSRGAFLGLLAAGFVLLFLRPPQRRWMFWSAAVFGAVLGATLVDQTFVERMFTIKEAAVRSDDMDTSAESRFVLIEAQARMAVHYPHGSGHRGTAVLSPQYLDVRWLARGVDESEEQAARSSHNTFMTMLVEQGIPGMILYLWVSVWGALVLLELKAAMRRGVPLDLISPATACCAGIAIVWTAGQTADYLKMEVQVWLFAMLAVALGWIRLAVSRSSLLSPSSTLAPVGRAPTQVRPLPSDGLRPGHGRASDRATRRAVTTTDPTATSGER